MPFIEEVDASYLPPSRQSRRSYPYPKSFASEDVTEASLMYQQLKTAGMKRTAMAQRSTRFMGLGQNATAQPKEAGFDPTTYLDPSYAEVPKPTSSPVARASIKTIAQAMIYAQAGYWYSSVAGLKITEATYQDQHDARLPWGQAAYHYATAYAMAPHGPLADMLDELAQGDTWVAKAKGAPPPSNKPVVATPPPMHVTPPSNKPVVATPPPMHVTPPPAMPAQAVVAEEGGIGKWTWFLVAGAAVVAFFAFRPSAKPAMGGLES